MEFSKNVSFIVKQLGEKIKAHKKTALFVPTALGGALQFTELSRIGLPYVRYFSVSQIIADGILCCFIILLTVLLSVISGLYAEKITYLKSKYDGTGFKKMAYDLSIFFIAYAIVVLVAVLCICILSEQSIPQILYLTCILLISGFLTIIIVYFSVQLYQKIFPPKVDKSTKAQSPLSKLSLYGIMASFGLAFLTTLYLASRDQLKLPETLENTKHLYAKIGKKFPENKERNIIYNNDKFIFIEVIDKKDNTHIEIFEFKSLFQ